MGGNAGWEFAPFAFFRPDFRSDNESLSPSRAATLNDNCSGSICKTKGGRDVNVNQAIGKKKKGSFYAYIILPVG